MVNERVHTVQGRKNNTAKYLNLPQSFCKDLGINIGDSILIVLDGDKLILSKMEQELSEFRKWKMQERMKEARKNG